MRSAGDRLRLRRAIALVWQASPPLFLLSLLLVLLQAVLPLAGIWLLKLLVDRATAAAGSPASDWASVYWLIAWTGLVFLAGAVANGVAARVAEARTLLLEEAVADRLHASSIAVDFGYYEDPRYYDTLHLAQQEAAHRPGQVAQRLQSLALSLVGLLGLGAVLISLHWALALGLAAATVPAAIVRILHSRRLYRWRRSVAPLERRAWYLGWILTRDTHAKEVRLFGLGPEVRRRWRALRERLREQRLGVSRRQAIGEILVEFWVVAVVFASLAAVTTRIAHGAGTVGDLVLYVSAVQRGVSWLREGIGAAAGLYEDNLFLAQFFELLDLLPTVASPPAPRAFPRPIRHGIALENVTFRYPGAERSALDGVSLTIAPGEIVAVVGENGSGKTTLMKLLCRLYDPTAGVVRVDGTDFRDLDLSELRGQLAPLFQDFARYHLTARDNVAIGDPRPDPADEALNRAGEAAAVRRTIDSLPEGWDTQLGRWFERGAELSAGQWQRLALARTLYRNAQVLLLDEPTSALDAAAEADLGRRLRDLVAGRATLLISHHPAAATGADRVVVLRAGRIVEEGRPAELLARGGEYARLYGTSGGS